MSCQYTCLRTFLSLVAFAGVTSAQEAHTPSATTWPSDLLAVTETFSHTYGPFDLKADTLQQAPPGFGITPNDDLWLVGYGVEIVDESGNKLARELQCHTSLTPNMPDHLTHDAAIGIFSDGYTESMRIPPGFGLFFKAGEGISWHPMFNNRSPTPTSASLKVRIDIIRAHRLRHPLKSLETTLRTVQKPEVYYVKPGRDVRENTFELPEGRIHAMGTHIHPYGVSIELTNLTRGEPVWKAVGITDADGNLVRMPVYASIEGYPVDAGDRFKLVVVYENTTKEPIDAMAGLFVLYSEEGSSPTHEPAEH